MNDSEKLDLLLKALQYLPINHKSNCRMQRRYSGGTDYYIDMSMPCTCGYDQLRKDLGLA